MSADESEESDSENGPKESTEPSSEADETPGLDEVYCRNCGEIIAAQAEICPECGVRQRSPQTGAGNDPGIAAVASLLIPGAGQIYLGHLGRGLALLVGSFVAGLLSIFLIGIPLLLGIWVYAIYDAYHLGKDPSRAE